MSSTMLPHWVPVEAVADCARRAPDDAIVVVTEGKSGGGHVKAMAVAELGELAEEVRQLVESKGFAPTPLPCRWLLVLHERGKPQLVRIKLPQGA